MGVLRYLGFTWIVSYLLGSPSSNPIKIAIALEELGLKYQYNVLQADSGNFLELLTLSRKTKENILSGRI